MRYLCLLLMVILLVGCARVVVEEQTQVDQVEDVSVDGEEPNNTGDVVDSAVAQEPEEELPPFPPGFQ